MHQKESKKRRAVSGVPESVSAGEAIATRENRRGRLMTIAAEVTRTTAAIPFCDRPTCRIDEACEASGLGRSSLYEAMKDGRLAFAKVGKRTLISVPSLLRLIGAAPEAA
jgi:excisionase family DNA binding protein